MVEIVTAPATVLSEKAKPVKKIDPEIKKIINNMIIALNSASDPVGVGLAAPQIGLSLQIFITKPLPNSKIQVFINPKIISKGIDAKTEIIKSKKAKQEDLKLEGCLSLPNIWGEVKRKPTITISYLDETGKKYKKTFKGFMAIIIQHEMDHLNGVLFPKKVLEQKGTLYKSTKGEKNEDVFEEISV